jgi:hypothetical protein
VTYEKDAEGNLTRVLVNDEGGVPQYYGVFTSEGVSVKGRRMDPKVLPQAQVKVRGGSVIEVRFNLRTAGEVRCDLVTLSGRNAATLLEGHMDPGDQRRSIHLGNRVLRGVAGGVYVVVVSVDGVTMSRSRYVHQSAGMGGVR